MLSLRWEVYVYETILIPPLDIEVPVQSLMSSRSCTSMYVKGVNFPAVSTISDWYLVWYFFFIF